MIYSKTRGRRRKAYLTLGFFFICCFGINGQDQRRLDSLETAYRSGKYDQRDKLKILKELAINLSDSEKKLFYSEALIQSARSMDSLDYLFHGFMEKGTAFRLKSDLTKALETYIQGAKFVGEEKQSRQLGVLQTGIADVYAIMGNSANAFKYYHSAIHILRKERDSLNEGNALSNVGDLHANLGQLDSALSYTRKAETIYKKIKYRLGLAYTLGNTGAIYAKLGNNLEAEEYMNEAITLLEELHEYYPIAVYLKYIADIYLEKGDKQTALNYAFESLELAHQYGMKKEVSEANLQLSRIYERAGKLPESFKYYKNYVTYKDSVNNIVSVQQMADLRTEFEVSKKQIEVDLLNQQKKNQRIIVIATATALLLICLLALGLYRRNKFIRETNRIIETERNRSETLLLNILPRETAHELKLNGKVQAKKFESVTVLFTDFKGFTNYAEKLSPELLVESVDFYFSKFDEIMEKYGLEKIKTVGDAYMSAGGLPFPTKDHAFMMVRAALEIVDFVNEAKASAGNPGFDIRIGINTGPVVAGVVGTKKFAYDIWGDTVNIASRMESNSEPGRINVSENTYKLIKEKCDCDYRGEIEVKNKGMMKMFFINTMKG